MQRISYLAIPLGYRMWQKKETKLELTALMVRQVMPEFQAKRNVIILCDSWYVKSTITTLVNEYENLDLIGNSRVDTAIYDLPPAPSGKRGRPAKRGRRLSIIDDFTLTEQKIGGYYMGARTVLTNIFGDRKVHFAFSEGIRQEIFFAKFATNTENDKKSIWIIDSAKQWF